MEKLAQLSVVRRHRESKQEILVRLHDLVLEICVDMAEDRRVLWHNKLMDSYLSPVEG